MPDTVKDIFVAFVNFFQIQTIHWEYKIRIWGGRALTLFIEPYADRPAKVLKRGRGLARAMGLLVQLDRIEMSSLDRWTVDRKRQSRSRRG